MAVLFTYLSTPSFADEVRIGAGAAPTENVFKPIKGAFEKATGLTLAVISNGPKQALFDLDRGNVDAAAAGLSYEEWQKMMKKEGSEMRDPAAYHSVVIGKDRIVVLTHKDNRIEKLSKEQLQGIFTGKFSNWNDVGGKDMPILVVWGSLIPGTNSMFVKNMLDGAAPTKEVLEATTAEDIKDKVKSNLEAIGIGPAAAVDAQIWSPQTPEIARPITLLTKGAPSPKVQKLIDFIMGDGAKLVK
jgi:phosphate transport system substrate-binding protein